ncbi:MAG: hypothetical protein QOH31_1702 [Verrucomicrobiota bacterium]|jgi:hypothetical protein
MANKSNFANRQRCLEHRDAASSDASAGQVRATRVIGNLSQGSAKPPPWEPVGFTAKRFKDSARGFNPGNASNQARRPERAQG